MKSQGALTMKVIIQIPCYNEETTLPRVLEDLPQALDSVDGIEVLVVDDGSTDRTAEVASAQGVRHVVRHTRNRGLARAFQTGLNKGLELGADIIVNTDGDHQYPGRFIAALIAPILSGKADIVIGNRDMGQRKNLPLHHRLLQRWGSAVVRKISGTDVPDAPSGFRAWSREAAMNTEVLTDYTYTLETIIQAEKKGLRLAYVPIDINPQCRESRLKRGNWHYVRRSAGTLLRLYALFQPLKSFFILGSPFMLLGLVLWARYLAIMLTPGPAHGAHLQSIVVGAASILVSVILCSLGILGDIMVKQRMLSERTLYLQKRSLFDRNRKPIEAVPDRATVLPPGN
jgi:glycosyltransferase involved in cell wall biosynthesis